MSFKYGDSERMAAGRFFNDMNENLLHEVIAGNDDLELFDVWTTDDARREHKGGTWLNSLARKQAKHAL